MGSHWKGCFWEATNVLNFVTWVMVVTWFHLLSDNSLSSTFNLSRFLRIFVRIKCFHLFVLKWFHPRGQPRGHCSPTEVLWVGLTTGSPEAEGQSQKRPERRQAPPALQDCSSSSPVKYPQESHQTILLESQL